MKILDLFLLEPVIVDNLPFKVKYQFFYNEQSAPQTSLQTRYLKHHKTNCYSGLRLQIL